MSDVPDEAREAAERFIDDIIEINVRYGMGRPTDEARERCILACVGRSLLLRSRALVSPVSDDTGGTKP